MGVAVFSRVILRMMGLPEELMDYALPYLCIVGSVFFTQALLAVMSAVSRNYGQARISMYVILGMNALNLAGNCIVVYRPMGIPEFGVMGISVSTVISQVVAVVEMQKGCCQHAKL